MRDQRDPARDAVAIFGICLYKKAIFGIVWNNLSSLSDGAIGSPMQVGPVEKTASGVLQFSLVTRITPPLSTITLYYQTTNSNRLQFFLSHLGES